MRKKQKNPYKPVKKLTPPYLTSDEITQFQSQFTLFDKQLNIKRFYETINSQSSPKNDKLVGPFIATLKQKQKIGFDEYINEMDTFFHQQNINGVILDVLGHPQTGQISKQTIKEVLQDALGREIELTELKQIVQELKKDEKSLLKPKRHKSQLTE